MKFNKIKWKKKGLVIQPDKKYDWMQSHAMLPTPQRAPGRNLLEHIPRRRQPKTVLGHFARIVFERQF